MYQTNGIDYGVVPMDTPTNYLKHNPQEMDRYNRENTIRRIETGLLPDYEIEMHVEEHGMISPFENKLIREDSEGNKVISYGLSSYGYDIRLGNKFKIFTNVNNAIVDPKQDDPKAYVEVESDTIIIPPNSFILAHSMERFKIPRDVSALVTSKSTYARNGNVCIATPLEAGWEGYVTLEFANTTPTAIKMYAGEGCAQVLFFKSFPCKTSYADRGGKYMNQPAEPVPGKA